MSDQVHDPAASPPPTAASSGADLVTVHLDESGATEFPFLLERSGRRMSRSFVASVGIHVSGLLVFLILAELGPSLTIEQSIPEPAPTVSLVWLPIEGPGGGGGGGGNESPEPPRKLELPGPDLASMPVSPPPKLEPPPKDAPEPPPLEGVTIPALTMAAGLEVVPGIPDGTGPPDSPSLGSGSGGGAGTGRGTGIGSGEGSGLGPGSGGGTGGGVFRPGSGITSPRVIREVKPQYTPEAMRAKIQGEVWLEVVVLPDGSVGNIEVTRSLDAIFGLDQEAMKAAKQWRFVPGSRQGQPVPVLVVIAMSFNLR